MPYRTTLFTNNYFYHVFNRGVEKRTIFQDERDCIHFLRMLNYYQHSGQKPSYSRARDDQIEEVLVRGRNIEVISYCFMPNHFHFLLKQLEENGVTDFMRKISNGYTKYFNTKHKRVGPLFQGSFKAVLMESDQQLVHVSRYVHLNPLVSGITKDLKTYPWSSYPDYVGVRDGKLVNKQEILGFYKDPEEYEKFVLDQYSYALDLERIKHQLLDGEN